MGATDSTARDGPCPSRPDLESLVRGGVAGDPLAAMLRHLGGCPPCLSSFLTLIRDANAATEPAGRSPSEPEATRDHTPTPAGPPGSAPDGSGRGAGAPEAPVSGWSSIPLGATGTAPFRPVTVAGGAEGDRSRRGARPPLAVVHERFEVLGALGAGGMGVVYDAFDRERRARVALKALPRIDADSLYRFKREFRARSDLDHPNLVTLHELFSVGDQWFFTMDRIEGVDFLAYHREAGGGSSAPGTEPPATEPDGRPAPAGAEADGTGRDPTCLGPPVDAGRLRASLRQLADGLIAVHDAGLLHRDIKPSNVLVEPSGRVVILDFGLVVELGEGGAPGGPSPPPSYEEEDRIVVGTAAYMAPEQAAGRPVTAAADWYSVGVMLFEILTGRRPIEGSPLSVMRDKVRFDPPRPRALAPDTPADLDALCVALLDRRPEARPIGREVLRHLRGEPDAGRAERSADAHADPATEFVGRSGHLEALGAAYEAMRRGACVTMRLHGRSGVGKSTLVRRFLDSIEGREAVVLRGRCYEQESVPYKGIDSLIDALARHLGRLPSERRAELMPVDPGPLCRVFPVLQGCTSGASAAASPRRPPGNGAELRRLAFAQLRGLLVRLGARSPLVLVIDDLQWADVDSAKLLGDLLRGPGAPRLLLLAVYRSEDAGSSEFLRRFLDEDRQGGADGRHRELSVEPLSADEARELTRRVLGPIGRVADADAAARIEAVARESRGIPFFVHELAEQARDGSSWAEGAGGRVDLDEVLWTRIGALPEAARRLLEVVAVAGRPIRLGDAYEASGIDRSELRALVALRSGRLVRGTGPGLGDEVATFHDRIREGLLARLGPELKREHHRRLAAVFEASGGADPETLAAHLAGAGDVSRAARYYELAADRSAEALAFDRAARLYRAAITLRGRPDAEEAASLRKLADALVNAGMGGEAAGVYRRCAACAEGVAQLELQRRAAYHYCIVGSLDEGRAMLDTILRRVGLRLETEHRRALAASLMRMGLLRLRGLGFREREASAIPAAELERIDVVGWAGVGTSMIDSIPSVSYLTRGLLLALRAGEPCRVARYLSLFASIVATRGIAARGQVLHLLGKAEAIVRRLDEPAASGELALAIGNSEFFMGRWRAAREALARAESIFTERCAGAAWERNTALTFGLMALANMGRHRELAGCWDAERGRARDRGDRFAITMLDVLIGPQLRLAADEPELARRELRAAMTGWSRQGFHIQHYWMLESETLIDLYLGDGASALRRLQEHWGPMARSLNLRPQILRAQMVGLRGLAAVAAGRSGGGPRALRIARRDAGLLAREGLDWSRGLSATVLGNLHELRGDRAAAARSFASAAVAFDASDSALHAAAARRRYAELVDGGAAILHAADAQMAAEGVLRPDRFTLMLTGGGAEG